MFVENHDELCLDEHLRYVIEALVDIKHKWYEVGLQLGLSSSVLDGIEEQCSQNLDKALREMLKKWLKEVGDKPHTWTDITDALRRKSVGESKVADEIESKYINQDKPGNIG